MNQSLSLLKMAEVCLPLSSTTYKTVHNLYKKNSNKSTYGIV